MYRRMDDSYPDNSTNFTTNEQTHQEQLQPAVKKPLEHEEEASHTPTATHTQPRFAGNPYNGLRNQGATCYLNSVLQCFYMTEDFRREVENFTRDPTNNDEESTALIEELQKLFKMLKKHDGTTKGITQCLGIYSVYAQQDVVEYYQKILYMITPQMSKIFMGWLKTTTKCLKCHQQEQKTPIFCIPLPINSEWSEVFSVAIRMENFSKIDELGKDNQIYCDLCEQRAEAETWTEIETFPTILTVNLKRFHNFVKNYCSLNVSLQLAFKNHTKYEHYTVINHMGGENGGHYSVVIKSFDDSFVTKHV